MSMSLILIVDDDEDSLFLMDKIVKHANYETLIAKSGDEALKHCREASPNLIFLDYSLPDRNGLEVLSEIRNIKGYEKIPVILITAHDMQEEALDKGANDYLSKPFRPVKLLDIAKKYLCD